MNQRSQVYSLHQRFMSSPTSEDLAHGQFVIVAARWILVLSGLVLALWLPLEISELRVQVVVLLLLAVVNFYLHAQLLMRRPTADSVAYIASAADLFVITVLVMQGGAGSSLYIFYFPAILAISVAFPTEMVLSYLGTTMLVYASVYLYDLDMAPTGTQAQVLLARLLMMAAVAICGNAYWRIEGRRRQDIRERLFGPEAADEQIDVRPQRRATPVQRPSYGP